jgi:hypothetical protein
LSELAQALEAKKSGANWMARCPAHEDRRPSLSLCERNGRILVHCFAGCTQAEVIAKLRERGLWVPERQLSAHEYIERAIARAEQALHDRAMRHYSWGMEEVKAYALETQNWKLLRFAAKEAWRAYERLVPPYKSRAKDPEIDAEFERLLSSGEW